MKKLTLILAALAGFACAKNMTQGAAYYNLALYLIDTLGTISVQCDTGAISDSTTEWMCANYPQGYETFINAWEQVATSQIVKSNYDLEPATNWSYFNETDGSVDFYGRAYNLGQTQILIAYDPSEQGREIYIGVSPNVMSVMSAATGSLDISIPASESVPTQTTLTGSYNCIDFATQADAIAFFEANGFNSSYDPYKLDADNNGIPCESIGETVGDSEQCPAGESWVNSYERSDGAQVRGHCRKKR